MEYLDNVWEHADALAMAIRLHVARKAPKEIEDLLGVAVASIARMATLVFYKDNPGLAASKAEMLSHDAQGELVFLAFRAISEGKVDTSAPKSVVSFFVKIAQNRLRNMLRDRGARRAKADVRTESELGISTADALAERVSDLRGTEIENKLSQKKREANTWERK